MRRAARAQAAKRGSWKWVERPITADERLKYPACRDMLTAYFNDLYSVQIYVVSTEMGDVLHLIVRSQSAAGREVEPPWRDMQRIKDELVGEMREAIQVYPRRADVVDQADVYHLWVMPGELPFGLHRENGLRKS